MRQYIYYCHRKCTEPRYHLAQKLASRKPEPFELHAEWQHGHKTVPETFSHAMIYIQYTQEHCTAAQLAEKGSQSGTKGIPVCLDKTNCQVMLHQWCMPCMGQPGPVTVAGNDLHGYV